MQARFSLALRGARSAAQAVRNGAFGCGVGRARAAPALALRAASSWSLPSTRVADVTKFSRDYVMDIDDYAAMRSQHVLPARRAIKGVRRVEIGPFVTVNFENFDLIWIQIHEMLRIERGGEEQIKDEIEAYEPLIPRNGNICATLMIEIDNREKRRRELSQLGFIENTVRLQIGDVSVVAAPLGDDDVPRTDENGRTSAVHFLRFHFDDEAVARVREADEAHLIIEHDHYRHSTRLRPELVQEICRDLKR